VKKRLKEKVHPNDERESQKGSQREELYLKETKGGEGANSIRKNSRPTKKKINKRAWGEEDRGTE